MSKSARILCLDTYYPDFIKALDGYDISTVLDKGYTESLKMVLSKMFGTGDSYSYWIKEEGWETSDIIGNFETLQRRWHAEQHFDWQYNGAKGTVLEQIKQFDPDVLFLQDLSYFDPQTIRFIREEYHVSVIAAQCSCPWPGDDQVKMCDVVFTSFPHYVDKINATGARGVYSKLAFDPRILKMVGDGFGKSIPVTFVGGVGYPSHWKSGLEVLETLSKRVEEFKWFGYGVETLPTEMELKKRYIRQAWGLDMYNVLARASIVLNRHGEVAKQYANNMKLFETTGMGAMLLTDHKENLSEMFEIGRECVSYSSPEHASDLARFFIEHPNEAKKIAEAGQRRTLKDHTYAFKMKGISDILKEML